MPDRVDDGWFFDELIEMGMHGIREKYKTTGLLPQCVCLIHGVNNVALKVTIVRQIRPHPDLILVDYLVVPCWQSCGYYLSWRAAGAGAVT